jgi:hypothetical protein
MGLTLEFYMGDVDAIVDAVQRLELEALDDPAVVASRADLSLHLVPHDLDTLSRAIGRAAGVPPIDLRPHLEPVVDEADHGLLAVDPTWVAYVAAAHGRDAAAIAEDWAARMQRGYGDPGITATDAMVQAVEELIALCASARQEGAPVVHAWFL